MVAENLKLEDLLGRTQNYDKTDRINNVTIIGAGVMGQGIAQTIASAGIEVRLIEKSQENLEKAETSLSESLEREIKRWSLTQSEKKSILSRITWQTDFNDIAETDLLVEAVDEDFELKKRIFKQLVDLVKKETIFVSNTSTLSL